MIIDTALAVLLSPILATQAIYVVSRAQRLPEPDGPRSGQHGNGAPMRLLVIGDSSAAGVGVAHQDQALASQLAKHLSAQNRGVRWHLAARNGATSAHAHGLLHTAKDQKFDAAFVVFGVNDVKNLRLETSWRRDLTALAKTLRTQHQVQHIFFSGLPPMGDFPLLPRPLSTLLGRRAKRFETALDHIATGIEGGHLLKIDLPLDPSLMASDGFHPGEHLYKIWAKRAAEEISARLT